MKTTKDYVAALRSHMTANGLSPSKYRIARELDISELTVTYWERGARTMDDESALKVAQYLGIAPGEVLIAMAYERARTPAVRKTWERAAKALAGTAFAALMGCSGLFDITVLPTQPVAFAAVPNIHYAHYGLIGLALKTALALAVLVLLSHWTRNNTNNGPLGA